MILIDMITMKTKILGRTGIELPIAGLGTAFTGIPSPAQTLPQYEENTVNAVDEALGVQTLIAALEVGCTFIDTALLYGRTLSEKMIGQTFKARPDLARNCIVTTKCGRRYEGYDFSFDAVVRDVYESLERLGLERFEVVYIHDPMDFPMDEVLGKNRALGALRHLQDEGVVRHVGVAANEPETNAQYIATGEFDAAVIADAWSMLNQTALREIFPAAEKHNVGLVAATPIERGLLATGPIAGMDYLNRNFSQACLDHVARVQKLCQDHHLPMLAVALQWCTPHPLVASTIPGARTAAEAKASIQAAEVEIPEAFWDELAPLIKHFETGVDR